MSNLTESEQKLEFARSVLTSVPPDTMVAQRYMDEARYALPPELKCFVSDITTVQRELSHSTPSVSVNSSTGDKQAHALEEILRAMHWYQTNRKRAPPGAVAMTDDMTTSEKCLLHVAETLAEDDFNQGHAARLLSSTLNNLEDPYTSLTDQLRSMQIDRTVPMSGCQIYTLVIQADEALESMRSIRKDLNEQAAQRRTSTASSASIAPPALLDSQDSPPQIRAEPTFVLQGQPVQDATVFDDTDDDDDSDSDPDPEMRRLFVASQRRELRGASTEVPTTDDDDDPPRPNTDEVATDWLDDDLQTGQRNPGGIPERIVASSRTVRAVFGLVIAALLVAVVALGGQQAYVGLIRWQLHRDMNNQPRLADILDIRSVFTVEQPTLPPVDIDGTIPCSGPGVVLREDLIVLPIQLYAGGAVTTYALAGEFKCGEHQDDDMVMIFADGPRRDQAVDVACLIRNLDHCPEVISRI